MPDATLTCTPQQVETARLVIQGRALRSIVHELSNPLQAVTSALSLAREDLRSPADLLADLDIAQPELARMKTLLYAVRRLYHPPEDLTAAALLDDLRLLSRKVLQWHNLVWEADADDALGAVGVACPDALVAALGALQHLAPHAPEGRTLHPLRVALQGAVCVAFHAGFPLPAHGWEHVGCLLASCGGKLTLQPEGVVLCFPARKT